MLFVLLIDDPQIPLTLKMKISWKKPWTLIAWILKSERFEAEEDPDPMTISRYEPFRFFRWFFGSEAEPFEEEPVMKPDWFPFGKNGFWKWLFAPERLMEEPVITVHSPRFGKQAFFCWLFSPEGKLGPEEGSEKNLRKDPRYKKGL